MRLKGKRFLLGLWLVLFGTWLAGAAAHAQPADMAMLRSAVLLRQQLLAADGPRPAGPRVILAGFAMHSQSTAFRNDVVAVERLVLAMDPHAVVFKLANPAPGQDDGWPYATERNMFRFGTFDPATTTLTQIATGFPCTPPPGNFGCTFGLDS